MHGMRRLMAALTIATVADIHRFREVRNNNNSNNNNNKTAVYHLGQQMLLASDVMMILKKYKKKVRSTSYKAQPHHGSAQVWHAFSRKLTVILVTQAFIHE